MAEIAFRQGFLDDTNTLTALLEIYHLSFPENERQPDTLIVDRCLKGLYELHTGWINNQLVFMALLWPLQQTSFILLDYMATHPEYKGKKIASQFLLQIKPVLASRKKYIILETEDPAKGTNTTEREKRFLFYRRNHAKVLHGITYTLPALQGTVTTAMVLMIFSDYPANTISAAMVKQLITQIYKELYNLGEKDALAGSSGYESNEPIPLL